MYAALAATLVSAAIGALAHMRFNLGGSLSAVGCVLAMMMLSSTHDAQQRQGYLLLFGFLKGACIGPLVQHAVYVDPAVILTAFLGTAVIFVCFSLAAMLSPRRSFLYLGGVLSSLLGFMLLASVLQMFFRSELLFNAQVYLGLGVFCAYVLYDTQVIIEKADQGSADYTWHACELFIDFVAVFVRIVLILLQNKNNNDERKKSKNR